MMPKSAREALAEQVSWKLTKNRKTDRLANDVRRNGTDDDRVLRCIKSFVTATAREREREREIVVLRRFNS